MYKKNYIHYIRRAPFSSVIFLSTVKVFCSAKDCPSSPPFSQRAEWQKSVRPLKKNNFLWTDSVVERCCCRGNDPSEQYGNPQGTKTKKNGDRSCGV